MNPVSVEACDIHFQPREISECDSCGVNSGLSFCCDCDV